MSRKHLAEVEDIFHTALGLSGERRSSYLSRACVNDDLLRSEIDSLISAYEKDSNFLEASVFSDGINALQHDLEKRLIGQTIGFYEIKKKLGSGGMGNVYLAEDTRLNRKVALKFLKDTFLDDAWAKRQFIREAQSVAILEHPNICTVHSIEEVDSHNFIVMQYIDGISLTEFIESTELSYKDLLSISTQIVSALAVAHSHGVIHRDIKPGNIMITPGGQVKVLDFGLAKVVQQRQMIWREDENTSHVSQNGLILGTVAYMSPEQLRGEKLDYRTDIFSLGIVLYELLHKNNPFNQKSKAETIAAILNKELLPETVSNTKNSVALTAIVQKCLNKEKESRFQSAIELAVELENLRDNVAISAAPGKFTGFYRYAAFILFFLLITGIFFFLYQRNPRIPTLAVLPFANESRRADNDYVSVGLTENLINKFSRLPGLKVIAQPLVIQYEGRAVNPQDAGKSLNADVVLIGKIIEQDSALTLKVTLMNTPDGTVAWEQNYSVSDNQLLSVQQNISSEVISKMKPAITDDERRQLTKYQTQDPEALRQYYLGRYYWSQQHGANMKKAIECFLTATKLDPYYAQAWAGLADSYVSYSIPSVDNPMSPAEAAKFARAAAKNALEIDAGLAEPYTSLGMIEIRQGWNWQDAEADFQKSITLKPDNFAAHYGYSNLLVLMGRFDQALAEAKEARDLDPFSPNTELNLGRVFYYTRNYEDATRIYTKLAEENPDNVRILYGLGLLYQQTGKPKEATEIFERIVKTNKPLVAAALGYAYAKSGRKPEALQLLADLEQLSKERFVSSQEKAIIYFGLNERNPAFENLNKACEERFPALPLLLIDPLLDEFRADHRFSEVRKCANLPAS